MLVVDLLKLLLKTQATARYMVSAMTSDEYQAAWEELLALTERYQALCRQCGIAYEQQWLELLSVDLMPSSE